MPPPNTAYQLSFQVCPIILSGGVAINTSSGMLPIATLFSSGDGTNSLGLPFNINDLDDAFGAFNVLPGGTLVSQQIAKYPFANQSVAANATIREPLTISLIMDSPMRGVSAFPYKQMIFSALKATLDDHNNKGGTYIVYTPAYMYTDLIMTSMTDNSRSNNSLPQNAWRFDFEKPLVALADLQGAQNQLMSKISNGNPTDGSQTGPQVGTINPQSNLLVNPNAGLGGSIAMSFSNLMQANLNVMNFPAIPSIANFPFSVSS
jgi:hypothetical protein